jgi:cyclohexadienyl dehydratase
VKTLSSSLSTARYACAALFLLLFAGSATAQSPRYEDPRADVQRVLELIEQRLSLMPEVAAWKWHAKQDIVDVARERAVLDQSVRDAAAIGLSEAAARHFFDLQIRMARAVQEHRFREWRATTPPARGRELASELRPALDRVGQQLLVALYLAAGKFDSLEQVPAGSFDALRRHAAVDDALLAELRQALRAIRIERPATRDIVQRVGVLRVGTTGDYAPFSNDRGGALRGFDIQLAVDLARQLKVEVRFVRTSWPTLMPDIAARKFDIAASGISVTPEREGAADFSMTYHLDGKLPIVRCAERAKFASLSDIDREGVRIIVNPGGTNEGFVRDRIKQATVLRHADNRTIFAEIVAGRADAMVTDAIEVRLQALRHRELCAAMPEPITRAPKAVLIQGGGNLKAEIDAWLAPRIATGELNRQLQAAVEEAALPERNQ